MDKRESQFHSCLYVGRVRHRRWWPVEHQFTYRLFMLHLDLAELNQVFRGRWLWSTKRFNLAWFRPSDHEGDPTQTLDVTIRNLVEQQAGHRPDGPITLLTHLRYFGYCMNPVSFYYCWDKARTTVQTIVAEVHNTPWGQRHCYVLDSANDEGHGLHMRYRFDKAFHVSPFMPMHHGYDWRFTTPSDRLTVHMDNLDHEQSDRKVFDSTMSLKRKPITTGNLMKSLLRYPLMTGQVILAIYWQAFRLWLKKVPSHAHPMHGEQEAAGKS